MSDGCIKSIRMKLNGRELDLSRPQVMTIVNVTDDSFYDGSRTMSGDAVERRVAEAMEQGASMFDVGGYSSRPGAADISEDEEWRRVRRGLAAVRRAAGDVPVSVDTFRSEVARRAIEEFGEVIINDISAGGLDPAIVDVAAGYGVPYIAMHMRGTPQTMQSLTDYGRDITSEVCAYFEAKVAELGARGVGKVILDPGFGFAKSMEQNYELMAGLHRLCAMGYPVLSGVSRKSMIYRLLGTTPAGALAGTVALNWESLRQGAVILRVHDTREAADAVRMFSLYRSYLQPR